MESLAYGAMPKELMAMSAELEELGGGDTRIAKMGVYVRVVKSPRHRGREIIAEDDGTDPANFCATEGGFSLSDPRMCGDDVPVDQRWRKYKTTGFFPLLTPQSDVHAKIGHGVVDWVLDGFSACVLMLGQAGSGKTYTLFGKDCHDDRGIVYRVLEELWLDVPGMLVG